MYVISDIQTEQKGYQISELTEGLNVPRDMRVSEEMSQNVFYYLCMLQTF